MVLKTTAQISTWFLPIVLYEDFVAPPFPFYSGEQFGVGGRVKFQSTEGKSKNTIIKLCYFAFPVHYMQSEYVSNFYYAD